MFRQGARDKGRVTSKTLIRYFYKLVTMMFVSGLLLNNHVIFAKEVKVPTGNFANKECIACHLKQNKELISAWRASAHGKDKGGASCVACHGRSHQNSAASARVNTSCINCHGGDKSASVHSYATSKHGVLYRLEQRSWDWSQTLAHANYRAPSCAYCHVHQGNHNVSQGVRHDIMDKKLFADVQNNMRAVCQDCHAPRYVTRLFENGEAMLEVGRMKVREASVLLQQARSEFSKKELIALEQRLKKMRTKHLQNVLLGVGHQSPDYQWWHGHPALDGDLLRLKGLLGELRRRKALTTAGGKRSDSDKVEH